MYKLNDIVTVLTTNGEYVGKFVSQDNDKVELKDPRFVSVSDQGMGFANGISMTGHANPKEVTLYGISCIMETNEQVQDAYRQMTSGLVTPPKTNLIV
jgi:hypothetical protein